MSVSGYSDRRFKSRLNHYVVFWLKESNVEVYACEETIYLVGCSVSRYNRQSEFTLVHFMIFH